MEHIPSSNNQGVSISIERRSHQQNPSAASTSSPLEQASAPLEQTIGITEPLPVEGSQAQEKSWIEEQRAAMITATILMAVLAIGVACKLPGGYWRETSGGHRAGDSILADTNPAAFHTFIAADATSFVASFSIIIMFMCGFKFNTKISIWFFLSLSWMSIGGIACGFLIYLQVVARFFVFKIAGAVVIALLWFGVALLLATRHIVRLIKMAVSSTPA